MSQIAIIPARGGSIRIPQKNIKLFMGRPIISFAIETAQKSGLFDAIVVSTDCAAIAAVARQYGAEVFERPMDDGTRGTQDVAREVLRDPKYANVEEVCVIYATSPLLMDGDLLLAHKEFWGYDADYSMSVQVSPLADAGCFYFGRAECFRGSQELIGPWTLMHPLPPERCCDINTMEDWTRAEQLYQLMLEGK